MASTLTTFASLLKRRYDGTKVEDLTQAERPLLAIVKKDEGGIGDGQNIPLIYGNPQGVAASLANAQTATSNLKAKHFVLTFGEYDGSVEIGDKVIKASRSNVGAFLANKTAEIDGLYSQMADDLSVFLYGNGGLALGRRSSASTNVITLTEPTQCFNFEEAMTVVASDNDGSTATDALRVGSTTVASVQRDAGTVTLTSAAAITSFADNDYLFRLGTFAGNTTAYVIAGLGAFLHSTGTSVPNLYSMVRTTDPVRLAGCRVATASLTGKSTLERLKLLGAWMSGRYKSSKFDVCMMHPEDWEALEISLMAQGTRSATDDTTRFGFRVINATLGGRGVKIYADPFCPKGTAFLLASAFWTLWSMGKLFAPVEEDGLSILRKSTTNDYEHRVVCYPALCTNAPLYSGRVTV
jgi:hypothetical protein